MNARLFCQTGALAGTNIDITKDILIGRKPSCDLVVYPHTVSGQHARIYFKPEENAYYIEDLGSSNGTSVDRVPVTKPMRLDSLNVITFASDIDFIFQVVDPTKPLKKTKPQHKPKQDKQPARRQTEFQDAFAPPPSFEPPTRENPAPKHTIYESGFSPLPDLEIEPDDQSRAKTLYNQSISKPPSVTPPARKAPAQLMLVVTNKGKEERFPLKPGKITIGRSSACDITISDPFISSSHASLHISSAAIILEDLGSSNKTYVEGKPISDPIKLRPNMSIRFGPNSEAKITKS